MNVGDLVKLNLGSPSGLAPAMHGEWGFGLVIGFVESNIPNHPPWVKVYWGALNHTSKGPTSYYKVIK